MALVMNCSHQSGKEETLLPLPPLRTVLDSFPSYGSTALKRRIAVASKGLRLRKTSNMMLVSNKIFKDTFPQGGVCNPIHPNQIQP